MKKLLGILLGVGWLVMTPALASAASISVTSLSPSNGQVFVNDRLTFGVVGSGFAPSSYQVTDSYSGTSVNASNLTGAGNFFWVPQTIDLGSHTFTITASDTSGNSATITQTVTVLPPPSIHVTNVTPGTHVLPNTTVTFNLNPTGFTNPHYSISDSFGGSSAVNATIDSNGIFTWTPDTQQNGDHTIYIYASDASGHSANVQQLIRVGAGPTLGVMLLSPGTTVPVGTTTTFTVYPTSYSPNSFTVSDNFPGSTAGNSNINTTGNFSWAPQTTDIGTHVLTITGTVGVYGDSASTSLTLNITGTKYTAPAATTPTVTTPAPTTASTGSPQATPATTDKYVFNNFMAYGEDENDGPDVLQLQMRLKSLGYLKATPNGYFGNATLAAVKKFQKANHISQTGYVGYITRAALNK